MSSAAPSYAYNSRNAYKLCSPLVRDMYAMDIANEWRQETEDFGSPLVLEFAHLILDAPSKGYELISEDVAGRPCGRTTFGRYGEALNYLSDILGDGFVDAAKQAADCMAPSLMVGEYGTCRPPFFFRIETREATA